MRCFREVRWCSSEVLKGEPEAVTLWTLVTRYTCNSSLVSPIFLFNILTWHTHRQSSSWMGICQGRIHKGRAGGQGGEGQSWLGAYFGLGEGQLAGGAQPHLGECLLLFHNYIRNDLSLDWPERSFWRRALRREDLLRGGPILGVWGHLPPPPPIRTCFIHSLKHPHSHV